MRRIECKWTVLTGDVWKVEGLLAGAQLRLDRLSGAVTKTETLTADANGETSYTAPGAPARVYVAYREKSTDPWARIGTLVVETLVDEHEEQLIAEVEDLEKRILAAEATHVQTQAADGMGLTRVALPSLRKQRAHAASRLASYRRRKRGIPPAVVV